MSLPFSIYSAEASVMRKMSLKFWSSIFCTFLLISTLTGCGPAPEPLTGDQEEEQPAETEPAAQPKPARTVQRSTPTPEPAPAPATRRITLGAGTPIQIVTSSTVSTKTEKTGESFQASLAQDIVQNSVVVARRGALVTGIVTDSDQGGRVKGVASLSVRLSRLTLADGTQVSIDTNDYTLIADSSKAKDAAKIGVGAGIGAAIGAIAGGGKGAAIGAGVGGAAGTGTVLATHGDPAVIPSETAITFELAAPVEVTVRQ
jgi:hypothetical protein